MSLNVGILSSRSFSKLQTWDYKRFIKATVTVTQIINFYAEIDSRTSADNFFSSKFITFPTCPTFPIFATYNIF